MRWMKYAENSRVNGFRLIELCPLPAKFLLTALYSS